MDVPRHVVHLLESVETGFQFGAVSRIAQTGRHLVVELVVTVGRGVHRHYDGRRLVLDRRQIAPQPVELEGIHAADVVAFAGDPVFAVLLGRVDIDQVVEYDVVYLADVERVVARPDDAAVGRRSRPVDRVGVDRRTVVVVVAHRAEHLRGVAHDIHGAAEVFERIAVGVPVAVPRRIAHVERVDGRVAETLRHGADVGDEAGAELFDVAVLVREVDVGHGQHHMAVVVDLRQGEIMPFDLLRGCFERSPEAGEHPVGRDLVSRRNRDEDRAAALVGRQPVTAFGIGEYDLGAVRYGYAAQRFVAGVNDALDRCAGLVGHLDGGPIPGCGREGRQRQRNRQHESGESSEKFHCSMNRFGE